MSGRAFEGMAWNGKGQEPHLWHRLNFGETGGSKLGVLSSSAISI